MSKSFSLLDILKNDIIDIYASAEAFLW